jgi:hypothetical protein
MEQWQYEGTAEGPQLPFRFFAGISIPLQHA